MDIGQVGIDANEPTGASTGLVGEDGDYASIVVPGAGWRLGVGEVEATRGMMATARVLLLQWEIDPSATIAAAELAHGLGVRVVLNAAPAPTSDVPRRLGEVVNVVVVNEGEARALTGAAGATTTGARTATALRDRLGVPAVVVTLGRGGAMIGDADGTRTVTRFDVAVVDTIGAGDAFVGTLASRLARGAGLDVAVVDANAAGALTVTRAGAYDALPTEAELRCFTRDRAVGRR